MAKANGCGSKHLKLAAILLPLILVIGAAAVGIASSVAAEARADSRRAAAHALQANRELDTRLRAVEQRGERIETKLDLIYQTLQDKEKKP